MASGETLDGVGPHRINAILLDFDGLILDTESAEYEALVQVFGRFGESLEYEEWRATVGHVSPDWLSMVAHPGTALYREAHEAFRAQSDLLVRSLPLLAGVDGLLAFAESERIPVAVVTSSTQERLLTQLAGRDVIERVSAVVTIESVASPKPVPDPYLNALAVLGADAGEALAFEDTAHGVAAAKAAGIRCVAVPTDVTRGLDFRNSDIVLDSLADLDLSALRGGRLRVASR